MEPIASPESGETAGGEAVAHQVLLPPTGGEPAFVTGKPTKPSIELSMTMSALTLFQFPVTKESMLPPSISSLGLGKLP